MKNMFWLVGKVINALTILSTLFFVIINMENITYFFSLCSIEATMSLNARYEKWLFVIFGESKGYEIECEIEHNTIELIRKGVNNKLCVIISIMMVISILLGIRDNSKANKRLRVYYVCFFVFMLIITFWASTSYINGAFDE